MSESVNVPAAAPAPAPEAAKPRPRGYFNQEQLEDLATAELVLDAAQAHAAELATRDITADYLAGFSAAIVQARAKTTETGQTADQAGAATLHATGTERALLVALQGIQSAAKQKNRMFAEDDDPATSFPVDGYLIGKRLNANRAALLQNAEALIAKARADALPGHDETRIQTVVTALEAYRKAETGQQETGEAGGEDRESRDALIRKINSRRQAIQHAADGLWPYTAETARPVRKRFQLPRSRPLTN